MLLFELFLGFLVQLHGTQRGTYTIGLSPEAVECTQQQHQVMPALKAYHTGCCLYVSCTLSAGLPAGVRSCRRLDVSVILVAAVTWTCCEVWVLSGPGYRVGKLCCQNA